MKTKVMMIKSQTILRENEEGKRSYMLRELWLKLPIFSLKLMDLLLIQLLEYL